MTTEQVVAVPVHAPSQLEKAEPLGAAAVKVTALPLLNAAVQVPLVQETLDGELSTVPDPESETVRFCVAEVSEPLSPPPPPQPTNAAASKATTALDVKAPKPISLVRVDMRKIDINSWG
jgi:hypothetical protein